MPTFRIVQELAKWPSTRNEDGTTSPEAIGSYRIERALGSGPVCRSWLASLGAHQAVVRVLRQPFAADEQAREEWLRASWAANRFHHGRVIKVIDQGVTHEGAPYVVRGWAEGESLEEMLNRAVVDVTFALHLAEQLLDVLEMAHAHRIVHGALSPSNIIVTARASIRLVDFATSPTSPSGRFAMVRDGRFTAPELNDVQAMASEQSDVWSVGMCLYCATAGRCPDSDRPDAAAPAAMNRDFAAVVTRALSRDPFQRYGSAYAMLGDVRRLLGGCKPLLGASSAPVPSQSISNRLGRSSSSSQTFWLHPERWSAPSSSGEWRGNLLLLIAISVLVAVATFVVMRERMAEGPMTHAMTQ